MRRAVGKWVSGGATATLPQQHQHKKSPPRELLLLLVAVEMTTGLIENVSELEGDDGCGESSGANTVLMTNVDQQLLVLMDMLA